MQCRLRPACLQMTGAPGVGICKRDCPTCDYDGCSLSVEKRINEPVYRKHHIVDVDLSHLDIELERERAAYKKEHYKRYVMYNNLFGDLKEKRKEAAQRRYHEDPEYFRERSKKWYAEHLATGPRKSRYFPPCNLDCLHCEYDDCTLPEDWLRQAQQQGWLEKNPNYHAEYRKKNRELLRIKNKIYYEENREWILEQRAERRADPEVKERRKRCDKIWRANNPDKVKAIQKRYRGAHREEINAKRREARRKRAEAQQTTS